MNFNAIDDPWLPVRFVGGQLREVGIREALGRAQEIEALTDTCFLGPPTQLRLLIALVQRVFQPEDADDWRDLWEAEAFDEAKLNVYFTQWRNRFELFHKETPFLQVGGDLAMTVTNPINKLVPELDPAKYNLLFSHGDGPTVPATPSEALRMLVVAQSCALGGGVSGSPTWNERKFERPNFSHAHIATGAIVYVEGKTLFETILLNLVPDYVPGDLPVWEQVMNLGYFERTKPAGPLDRLTKLSRVVRLVPETDMTGNIVVRRCCYTQGRSFVDSANDPMQSYRKDKEKGFQSLKISESRASWRDLHGLLQMDGDEHRRAAVLTFVGARVADGDLPASQKIPVRVAGVAADKAKVLLWRSEKVDLPLAFLLNEKLVVELAARMEEANRLSTELGRRVRSLCWHFLAPAKDQMSPDLKHVNALADQLDARQSYWAGLENNYPELLDRLAVLENTEPETIALVTHWWAERCANHAQGSLTASQKRLGETPRAWRALAAVSTNFN